MDLKIKIINKTKVMLNMRNLVNTNPYQQNKNKYISNLIIIIIYFNQIFDV